MLNPDDRDFVIQQLSKTLGANNPRPFLATSLPAATMEKIPIYDMVLPYAIKAVEVCVADRWNNTPSWLLLLLELLPPDQRLAAIKQRIATPRIEADPTLSSLLVTEEPFLDREDLRKKAKVLTGSAVPRPILVVNGTAKSGKSFTERYINHLRLSGDTIDYCLITFPSGSGLTLGPEQVAKQILEGAAVDFSRLSPGYFQNTTNNARWPYDLARSVLNTCAGVPNQYWILLDSFAGNELRDDTRKFVDGLGEGITRNTILGKKFRLVLLGFDKTALTVQPSTVDVDEIRSPGMTHVTDCVGAIFDRFQQPRPDLAPLVSRIMADLPQDETRMMELYTRLTDLIETVRETANG